MSHTTLSPRGPASAALPLATPAAVAVFTHILTRGPVGRVDVTRSTGLSQAAVTKTVNPLIASGILEETATSEGARLGRGRPVNQLRVIPDSILVLGLKVKTDEIIGTTARLDATTLDTVHIPIEDTTVATVVKAIAETTEALLARLGGQRHKVQAVGIAVSGAVDVANGVVRESPLLGWKSVPLRELLAAEITLPLIVENDVKALTVAENWFGVGVGASTFAIVTIGLGIGSGIYANGEVIEGSQGVAGELGHLPLASSDALCICGRYGCVEAEASLGSILNRVQAEYPDDPLTIEDVVRLAHCGDSIAHSAFDRAGTVLGLAIATMANLVGPEVVLVAGEAVAEYDLFEKRLREAFNAHAFGAAIECKIVTRSHTFDEWARGAAAAAIRALVNKQI
jgi:predicted NBD/HSP70 family sugar kinase